MTGLTERNRRIWSAGNWDRCADLVNAVGPRLLDAVGDVGGLAVLDVGTGSGGAVAVPAARRGARVTGLDVTDAWFDAARARAQGAGVDVEWVAADAMAMPFADGRFDRVLSTFGHMFAPDHERTAAEMARVCTSDGVLGFATWRGGYPTGMFKAISAHMPPPPDGVQPPSLWGRPEHVRALLEPHGFRPEFTEGSLLMPLSDADEVLDLFQHNFGPLVVAREALGDGWGALQADMRDVIATHLTAEGLRAEYLLTVARR